MSEQNCVIWVCVDCMLHHANGECGSCHEDRGHVREPWNLLDAGDRVTIGMSQSEHSDYCDPEVANSYECDCETREFSWSSCHGCGSTLGGSRYAFTLWWDES